MLVYDEFDDAMIEGRQAVLGTDGGCRYPHGAMGLSSSIGGQMGAPMRGEDITAFRRESKSIM